MIRISMGRLKLVLLLLLAALLAYWGKGHFFADEKQRVLAQLQSLQEAASFEGKRHPFEDLQAARQIESYFAENVKAVLQEETDDREVVSSREGVREKVMLVRTHLEQFAFKILYPDVKVSGDRAEIELTARAMGREPGRNDYFLEEHRIALEMRKISGNWLITRARNLDPIDL